MGGPDRVEVSPAAIVRQGQTGVTLTFTRPAGGLAAAAGISLGDLTLTRRSESTDQRLVLDVAVPHGARLGADDLTFIDRDGAPITAIAAVRVDPITAGPTGRDENAGTSAAPFRTLKAAVAAAGGGDTITLLDGAYDQAAGETWGYRLPDDVTVTGESTAGTVVTGPGSDADSGRALIATGRVAVRDLSVDLFDTGIVLASGALTMTGVEMHGAHTAGVRVEGEGASLTIDGSTLTSGTEGGHAVEIAAAAAGSRTTLDHDTILGDVLVSDTAGLLTVTSTTFTDEATDGKATINFNGQRLDVRDTTITLDANVFGINFNGASLALTGVTITGGKYGVYQLSGDVRVRQTTIRDYAFIGYYLAQGNLDLGTATDPGDNVFASEATGPAVFGLYVDAIIDPVTCSNTTFNGVEPPAGTRAAGDDDPIAEPGAYFINYGKTMSFWVL
jgi:hypothetical protein